MNPDRATEKQAAAQAAVDILHEMSTILVSPLHRHGEKTRSNRQNCHLDRRELSICISMIENGVSPVALAKAVEKLRQVKRQVDQS